MREEDKKANSNIGPQETEIRGSDGLSLFFFFFLALGDEGGKGRERQEGEK